MPPVAALLLVLAAPAGATTVRQMSLERLVRESDTTLAGTVLDVSSFWQGSRIYTLAQVQVDEVWVGPAAAAGRQLGVLTLGGRVGNIGQRVDGAAVLHPRHAVVLHLRRQPGGEYVPYGMAQGLWEVEAPARQTPRVTRQHRGALLGLPAAGEPGPRTLAQLRQAVLAVAGERGHGG